MKLSPEVHHIEIFKQSRKLRLGINRAYAELGITVPVVCRLEGTNVDSAKAILAASGNPVQSADSMEDAAKKAVATIQ